MAPCMVLQACEAIEEARAASATFVVARPPEESDVALAVVTVCIYRRGDEMVWGVVWEAEAARRDFDLIAPWEDRQDAATAGVRLLSRLTAAAKNHQAAIYFKGYEVYQPGEALAGVTSSAAASPA